ncbi:MAG: cupin domain-containing protein [Chitinophagaceae bacterium]|nr:cupin domain-containing protein [Chitinophagaceae bacterium]
MSNHAIQQLVDTYSLLPHPEGGFYKETYRSADSIAFDKGIDRFDGERSMATAIYFLISSENFSAFHRIKSDELWHFYAGGSLLVHVLHEDGRYEQIKVGNNPAAGEVFQAVVPAGAWFASECAPEVAFSFVGCTVSPGFDFADFELAYADALIQSYPDHATLIQRLCRQ